MKLILTADVPNLGEPGDIVEVKDGYGRNCCCPATWPSRPRAAQRSRSLPCSGPAGPVRSAIWATPRRSPASSAPSPSP